MKYSLSVKIVMGIIVMMLSPFFVQGQMLDPVSYSVVDAPDQVKAGEVFEVKVKASIDGEWHLYSIANDPDAGPYPTQFSSTYSDVAIAGELQESEPSIEMDPNFNAELGWHTKEATFTIPIALRSDVSGSSEVGLEVLYQVCDDKSCLPPKTKSIIHTVSVEGVADNPYSNFGEGNGGEADQEQVQNNTEKQEVTEEGQSQGQIDTSEYSSGRIFLFFGLHWLPVLPPY